MVTSRSAGYLDDAASRWPLDGLVVKLVATDLDHDRLNPQFDLPDGRGSFGETLVRQHPGRHQSVSFQAASPPAVNLSTISARECTHLYVLRGSGSIRSRPSM